MYFVLRDTFRFIWARYIFTCVIGYYPWRGSSQDGTATDTRRMWMRRMRGHVDRMRPERGSSGRLY